MTSSAHEVLAYATDQPDVEIAMLPRGSDLTRLLAADRRTPAEPPDMVSRTRERRLPIHTQDDGN